MSVGSVADIDLMLVVLPIQDLIKVALPVSVLILETLPVLDLIYYKCGREKISHINFY